MGDPRRWLHDDGASRAAVDLLRALEPPKAAPAATRAALGQQLAGMVAASATPIAAGIGWTKILVFSLAVAGIGTGAAVWTRSDRTPMPAGPSPTDVARDPATSVGPSSTGSESPDEPPPSPAEATAARPVDRPRAANAGNPPSAEPRDRLAEEEAILEEARKTVAQDPARALTLLRRHQSRFPNGELTAERMYLNVDCLSRLGKRDAAKREADALIQRYPNSAYARRAPLLLAAPGR
jgi:hypothetical protein